MKLLRSLVIARVAGRSRGHRRAGGVVLLGLGVWLAFLAGSVGWDGVSWR